MRISGWSSDVCSSDLLGELPEARLAGERARLNALGALVETVECRRALLLRHFGEHPPERCGNCDNCLEPPKQIDATVLAQKLLSAVYRTGQSYGAGHVEAVLTGRSDERIVQRGHDKLSVFRSEEHTSELQSLMRISYAVF